MTTVGFLNLPPWQEGLRQQLGRLGLDRLLQAPVMGTEDVERPWTPLEADDFASAVETGFHFPDRPMPPRWTVNVITADASLANSRLDSAEAARIGVRGAIGGTFPLLDLLGPRAFLPAPRRLIAMADGVAGFILAEMDQRGKTIEEAIREAQWQNEAPGNPTRHLHGLVLRERLALLGTQVFGTRIRPDDIPTIGCADLHARDIALSRDFGFTIRLLGNVEAGSAGIEAWVRPVLIPSRYLLAQVRGGAEAAYLQSEDGSSRVYTGPGTTPETVLRGMLSDWHRMETGIGETFVGSVARPIMELAAPASFYLRFSLVETVSTLARITDLLANRGLELAHVYQTDSREVSRETLGRGSSIGLQAGDAFLPSGSRSEHQEFVFFTRPMSENVLLEAIEQIKSQVKLATLRALLRYEV